MKIKLFLIVILAIVSSCSPEEFDYIPINGKILRAVNGEGIANQTLNIMTRKSTGQGLFSSTKIIDSTYIVTDANGNFSSSLIYENDAFVTIVHSGDEDYLGSGIYKNYSINDPIIIEVDKFIKFKINVKNMDPLDENDFIKIDFFAGLANVRRTKIENFGIENTHNPVEMLPGGGSIGPWEEASWNGMNVNSNIYYSVPESADIFKLYWYKRKGGIESEGFTDNIPFTINQTNTFLFAY